MSEAHPEEFGWITHSVTHGRTHSLTHCGTTTVKDVMVTPLWLLYKLSMSSTLTFCLYCCTGMLPQRRRRHRQMVEPHLCPPQAPGRLNLHGNSVFLYQSVFLYHSQPLTTFLGGVTQDHKRLPPNLSRTGIYSSDENSTHPLL